MSDEKLLRVSMNAAEENVEPIRKTRAVSTYRNEAEIIPLKQMATKSRQR